MKRITAMIKDQIKGVREELQEKRLLNKLESIKLEIEEEMTLQLPAKEDELLTQIVQWSPKSSYNEEGLKSLLQKYFSVRTRIKEKKAAVEEIDELLRLLNEEVSENELKDI